MPPDQSPFQLDPLPRLTDAAKYGIAIVGAGAIVNDAHLPSYASAGYRIVGITDLDRLRAQKTARRFEIPRVYTDLEELLADPAVQIVDIAVPPWAQESVLPQVLRAGRHVLCQKPLAETVGAAQEMVAGARDANVSLAVNLNMRWSPVIRALLQLLEQGDLGEVTSVSFQTNFWDTWETWSWLQDVERLLILYDAIHIVDALRFLFGQPESVYAVGSPFPGQSVRGETQAVMTFRYASGLTAFIHDSANNWGGDTYATMRVEGTKGIAKGILGIWYDYPVGRPDTLSFTRRDAPGQWTRHELVGRWVPDAFAWTMAELLQSVGEGRSPINSGEDHIKTLRLVQAIYDSMESGEASHLGR